MEAEAGMTEILSVYAIVKNASSGILILCLHRDTRCSCVQTRDLRSLAVASSLRKGSHPTTAIMR